MRKITLFLFYLLCFVSIKGLGQNSVYDNSLSDVLMFRNIPIKGNITDMVKSLQNVGYTLYELDNYVAILNGSFANENCDIVLYATPITQQMHSVTVSFGQKSSWYSLKSEYIKIKNLIKEKYNIIPDSNEKFYSPYYEGDGYEMQALRNDKCAYFSTFKVGNDKIGVYILEDKVLVLYQSSFGKSLNDREEAQKAYNDI